MLLKRIIVFSLFCLLFVGCSYPHNHYTESLPQDNASPLESSKLEEALVDIEQTFEKHGINKDIRTLPYIVTHLSEKYGACFYNRNGSPRAIAIDHKVFEGYTANKYYKSGLSQILLHEIGHCFFGLEHQNEEGILNIEKNDLVIKMNEEDNWVQFAWLLKSVMVDSKFHRLPKSLWDYYVLEVAGLARVEKWEDIKEYTDAYLLETEQ